MLEIVENFPLEKLTRYNRYPYSQEDLGGLKNSLAAEGQKRALVVARVVPGPRKTSPPTEFVVADGMRRLDAMRELGLTVGKVMIGDGFEELLTPLPSLMDEEDEFQVPWAKRQLHLGALYYRVLSPIGLNEQRKRRTSMRGNIIRQKGGSPRIGQFRQVAYEHLNVSETSMNSFKYLESILSMTPRPKILDEALRDLETGMVNMDGIASRTRKLGIYSGETTIEYISADDLNRITRSIDGLTPSLLKVTSGNFDQLTKEDIQKFLDSLASLKGTLFRVSRVMEKGL